MDDLFSTLIYLIPIAGIVFIRVVAAKKKAQAAKTRKAKEAEAYRELADRVRGARDTRKAFSPLSRVSGREAEQEWQPHWVEEAEPPSQDKRPVQPAKLPQRYQILPAAEPETAAALPPRTEAPAAAPASEAARPQSAAADLRESMGEAPVVQSVFHFPQSIERLSPLKKAIVLAEALGKPKAL